MRLCVGSIPTDPAISLYKKSMKCIRTNCNKELSGTQTKYCSVRCKNNCLTKTARKKIKARAVEYKGGQCQNCGYNKCMSALAFHHLDPSQKDFGIGGNGETRAWDTIKKELDKCVLLCANCHAEEHEKLDATLVDVVTTPV